MKVRHEKVGGYTITTTYSVGLIHHEQVDEYDKDGNWISSSTTMEEKEHDVFHTGWMPNCS